MNSQNITMKELADIMCEFFEVAIHSILFVRDVYPSNLFERRRKYNVPCHMSRSLSLNQYIWDIIKNFRNLIEKGVLEKVVVSIIGKEKQEREKYVFETDFRNTKLKLENNNNNNNINNNNNNNNNDNNNNDNKFNLTQMEVELRSFLMKVLVSDSVLVGVSETSRQEGCSFSVTIHTFEDTVSEYWVPVNVYKKERNIKHSLSYLIPIKSLGSESPFSMQLFIEKVN